MYALYVNYFNMNFPLYMIYTPIIIYTVSSALASLASPTVTSLTSAMSALETINRLASNIISHPTQRQQYKLSVTHESYTNK